MIGRGALIADTTVREFTALNGGDAVRVVTPDIEPLVAAVRRAGGAVELAADHALSVGGLSCVALGELIASERLTVYELTPVQASLEDAYMELTSDAVEYRSGGSRQAAIIGSGAEGAR